MSYRPYAQMTASSTSESRSNNTGANINKGIPVRVNSSGELDFIDVSVESDVLSSIAVASAIIPDGSQGPVVSLGLVTDIATSASLGDPIWVSKTGSLTNTKPDIGVDGFVSGDWVIFVGVIAKNESTPLAKDLLVSLRVIGQL